MTQKPTRRVCVIGLDGVPESLLRRLMQDGTMPTLAQLTRQGHLHRMKVTLPEISMVSWTSFMTGTGPGEHGIYGFIDLKPGSREIRFPQFRDVKVPTLWDCLAEKGKRSVIINQPATYPARRIQGALISGFVAIELMKAVYPLKLLANLRRMKYELDIDTMKARSDPNYLIQALHSSLQGRRKAVEWLWETENWDYFQLVVTGTDRLQHFLWNAIDDSDHPYHAAVRGYYTEVDNLIGEILDGFRKLLGSESLALSSLYLLSDHGFTGIKKEFNLNTWLRREGYQRLLPGKEPSLSRLSPDTRAFALDPSRIYFNRADRFPDGCVNPADIPSLGQAIREKLQQENHNGEPVVQKVLFREDLYSGPQSPLGPDMIVLTHYGYDAKGTLVKEEVLSDTDLSGMHTWDDAFFWASEKVSNNLNIIDLAGLIESRLE